MHVFVSVCVQHNTMHVGGNLTLLDVDVDVNLINNSLKWQEKGGGGGRV